METLWEIARALGLCAATTLILVAGMMFFPINNSKATGIELVFRLTGSRLALVGVLNVFIGLLLTRLTIVGDAAGHVHINLR
jgi:hypothetical protein